jgi:hypothetical protein
MDPIAIATLAEQLTLLALQIYNQVKSAQTPGVVLRPLADIIAEADATFDQIAATADAELAKPDAPDA